MLLESCAIAVIGGGIGLGLAWLIIAQGDPTGGMLPIFHFPPRDLVFGIVLVAVLGLGDRAAARGAGQPAEDRGRAAAHWLVASHQSAVPTLTQHGASRTGNWQRGTDLTARIPQ